MWKRLFSLILCFTLIFSYVRPALADDNGVTLPDITVPDGEKDLGAVISPMKKGDKAPFTGILLSPKAVATVIAQLHAANDQIKIEVDRARGEDKAQCDFKLFEAKAKSDADQKVLQAQIDAKQKELNAAEEQLKKAQSSNSWMPVYVGLGAAGGIGLTLLTVYTVSKVTSK
jgi:hypothetical protein